MAVRPTLHIIILVVTLAINIDQCHCNRPAYLFSKPCQSDLDCVGDTEPFELELENRTVLCLANVQRCKCPEGYLRTARQLDGSQLQSQLLYVANRDPSLDLSLTSSSLNRDHSSTCLKVALLGDRCAFSEQCVVKATFCPQSSNSKLYSPTNNVCACLRGYVARGE